MKNIAKEAPGHPAEQTCQDPRDFCGDVMSGGVRRIAAEEEYDSDDLQCSLEGEDTDVDDDEVSLTDYDESEDSGKENGTLAVKRNPDLMNEIGVLLKASVATPIRQEKLGGCELGEDEEEEENTPVVVRLKGYISPLNYLPV